MGTKYRTKSADVLNEADRYQKQLDWQLFAYEQERRLYELRDDVDWIPGEPLYAHPDAVGYRFVPPGVEFDADFIEWPGSWGNCPRAMIEQIEEIFLLMRCEDCEVRWSGLEPCWVCGEQRKDRFKAARMTFSDHYAPLVINEVVVYTAADVELSLNVLAYWRLGEPPEPYEPSLPESMLREDVWVEVIPPIYAENWRWAEPIADNAIRWIANQLVEVDLHAAVDVPMPARPEPRDFSTPVRPHFPEARRRRQRGS